MKNVEALSALVATVVVALVWGCGDEDVEPTDIAVLDAGSPREEDARAPDGGVAPPPIVDAGDDGAPRLAPTFVPFDVNHVLATGQSLSVGASGSPPLTTAQPYANLMFPAGPMNAGTGLTSFVPLVEGDSATGGPTVETMSSAFANLVTKVAADDFATKHDLLVSVHGISGTAYVGLKKGTAAYANGIAQVTAGRDVAKAAGKSYVVRAVTNVHGESDHISGNAAYAQDLATWQADYEADVKALTAQTVPVPMLQTQISSWQKFNATTSPIPAAQLAAHVASGGKIVLVGAKYHLPYAADGLHLTNAGYRHMGEDYAKVYRRVVLEGKTWEPVRPKSISRNGLDVAVTFHVPVPPLVLDTTLVTNPGSFGFEVVDGGASALGIASVVLTGPDSVKVVLTRAPVGAARLRYAHTATLNASSGPTTGPRGNLRDSDPTPSRNGDALYDWCIHFDEALP